MKNIEVAEQVSDKKLVWAEKRYLNYECNQVEYWYAFIEKNNRKAALLIRPVYNKKLDEMEYIISFVSDVTQAGILEKESPMYKFYNTGGYLLKGFQTIYAVKSTLEDAKESAGKIAQGMYPKCYFSL